MNNPFEIISVRLNNIESLLFDIKHQLFQGEPNSKKRHKSNLKDVNIENIKFTSRYNGVSYDSEQYKWYSKITINGKRKFLGRFTTELEAHQACQTALKEI